MINPFIIGKAGEIFIGNNRKLSDCYIIENFIIDKERDITICEMKIRDKNGIDISSEMSDHDMFICASSREYLLFLSKTRIFLDFDLIPLDKLLEIQKDSKESGIEIISDTSDEFREVINKMANDINLPIDDMVYLYNGVRFLGIKKKRSDSDLIKGTL